MTIFSKPTPLTAAYSHEKRSANAKKQLRDKNGKFIEMGGGLSWSGHSGILYSGIVHSFDVNTGYVTASDVHYKKSDGTTGTITSNVKVSAANVVSTPPAKAHIPAADTSKKIGSFYDEKTGKYSPGTSATTPDQKTQPDTPIDISEWSKVGAKQGSNPGGVYQSPDGQKYYVKFPSDSDHARNEVLARKLYDLAGVDSAQLQLADDGSGKLSTASPLIPGAKQDLSSHLQDQAYLDKIREGFAADAWLANWDVAGLGYDNIVTDANGDPVRVDPGGAMLYRAQGTPKGAAWGDTVGELDTLKTKGQAKTLFAGMTPEQTQASADRVTSISDQQIDDAVDSVGFAPATATALKARLKARRDDIASKYPPSATQAPAPTPTPDAQATTPDVTPTPSTSTPATAQAHTYGSPPLSDAQGPYVSDSNGQPLHVGDTVSNSSKGYTGTVVAIEGNGKYVQVNVDQTGKKHGLNLKNLAKTESSPSTPAVQAQSKAQPPAYIQDVPSPSAAPTELKTGDKIPNVAWLDSAPAGTAVDYKSPSPSLPDMTFVKNSDGTWTTTDNPMTVKSSEMSYGLATGAVTKADNPTSTPEPTSAQTSTPTTKEPLGFASEQWLDDAPTGSVVENLDGTYIKDDSNGFAEPGWYDEEGQPVDEGELYTSASDGELVIVKGPKGAPTAEAAQVGDTAFQPLDFTQGGSQISAISQLDAAPTGAIFSLDNGAYGGTPTQWKKNASGTWDEQDGEVTGMPSEIFDSEIADGSLTTYGVDDTPAVEKQSGADIVSTKQLDDLPEGSQVINNGGIPTPTLFTKDGEGKWVSEKSGAAYDSQVIANNAYSAQTQSTWQVLNSPTNAADATAPAEQDSAYAALPAGSNVPNADWMEEAPSGTTVEVGEYGKQITKDDNGDWVDDYSEPVDTSDYFYDGDVQVVSSPSSDSASQTKAQTPQLPTHQAGQPPLTAPNGQKYISDSSGNPIFEGSTVTHPGKGYTGKVVTVENNGKNYVQVQVQETGKKHGLKGNSLNLVSGPDGAAPTASSPGSGGNVSSGPKNAPAGAGPLWGTPPPVAPTAPKKADGGPYFDDEWLQRARERYAQAKPGKSLESSMGGWPRFQQVRLDGNKDALKYLLDHKFIDQSMHDEVAAKIDSADADYNAKLSEFNKAADAWKKSYATWLKDNPTTVQGGSWFNPADPQSYQLQGLGSAKDFATDAEGHSYGVTNWPNPTTTYDKENYKAVKQYTGSSYKQISGSLQTLGEKSLDPKNVSPTVKKIDKVFAEAPKTKEKLMVVRGMGFSGYKMPDSTQVTPDNASQLMPQMIGTVQNNWGYSSASLGANPAFKKKVTLHLQLPENYSTIYVDFPGATQNGGEREILLDRAAHYYIHKVEFNQSGNYGTGQWDVYAEIVPPNWTPPAAGGADAAPAAGTA